MIESIQVQNFKSIEDVTLPLGRVTVLIGENGGGKTNLLEAICLASATISAPATDATLVVRGMRDISAGDVFPAFDKKEDDGQAVRVRLTEEGRELPMMVVPDSSGWRQGLGAVLSPDDDHDTEMMSRLEALMERLLAQPDEMDRDTKASAVVATIEDLLQLQSKRAPEGFSSFAVYAPEAEHLRTFREEGQLKPLGARGEGLFKHLQDLQDEHPETLQKIVHSLRLISWFQDFGIPSDLGVGERRLAIQDRHLIRELDQRAANEGFLFLLFTFTLMWSPETPRFFAIDNVDEALNPRLCRELMKQVVHIAKETGNQVILTTHNPALLDGLDLKDEEQVLVAISRDLDGRTRADKVRPPRVRDGAKPVPLSKAFMSGYLGGLPGHF